MQNAPAGQIGTATPYYLWCCGIINHGCWCLKLEVERQKAETGENRNKKKATGRSASCYKRNFVTA